MNVTAMMVLFGLLVPVFSSIGNFLQGRLSKEAKEVQERYTQEHPIMVIIGSLFSFTPAIVYWIYVFTQL